MEQRVDEFINRPAITEDKEFMLGSLKEVMDQFKKLIDLKNQFNVGSSAKGVNDDTKNAIDELAKLAALKKKLLDEDLQFAKAQLTQDAALLKSKQQLALADSDNNKQIIRNREEVKKRNQELKNQVREEQAVSGSIEEMRARLIRLQREYDNIGPLQRSTNQGKNLQKTIKDLSKDLLDLEKATGRSQRNVGNYGEALTTLEKHLADVREALLKASQAQAQNQFTIAPPSSPASGNQRVPPGQGPRPGNSDPGRELVKYNQAAKQTQEQVKNLAIQEEALTRIVNSQVAGYASLTQQVKAQEKALHDLLAAGIKPTDAAYQQLLKDTAELKDRASDLKDEIKALASDTREIDLLVGAFNGLTQAMAVGVSVYELASGGSDDLQESMQRLEAVQNIAIGVQNLSNELTTKGTALNKLYNFVMGEKAVTTTTATVATEGHVVATEAAAVATTGLTTATRILRAALIGLGIGAIIAGIVFLLGKLEEWKQQNRDVREVQAELNKTLLEQRNLLQEIASLTSSDIGTRSRGLQIQLDLARALGKEQEEILKTEIELVKEARDLANVKFFNSGGAAELERIAGNLRKVTEEYNELIATKRKDGLLLDDDDYEKEKALLESQLALYKSTYAEQKQIVEDFYDTNRQLTLKEAELKKLQDDNRRRDLAAELEIYKIRKNALREYFEEQSSVNLPGSLQKQLIDRKKAFEAEAAIIERQRKFDVTEQGLRAKEIEAINVKANDDLRKSREKLYSDLLTLTQDYKIRENEALQADLELSNDIKGDEDMDAKLQQQFTKRVNYIQEGSDIIIASYEKERNAKLKAAEGEEERTRIEAEYQDKRARKELETNALILQASLELAQAKLKLVDIPDEQRTALDAEIANLKLQLEELKGVSIDLDIEKAKKKLQDLTEGVQKVGENLNTAFNSIGKFLENDAERRRQENDIQLEEIEERKDRELEALETTALSDQDKQKEKLRIEKTAANEREQINLRERRIKLQEARFEKARAITEAISQGALAVLSGLQKGGPVLAAIYGAFALVQIAAVVNAPLPRYRHGKKPDSKGHFGITGDGGQQEVLYSRDFKHAVLTPAKDTVTWIPDNYGIAPSVGAFNKLLQKEAYKPHLKALRGGLFEDQGAATAQLQRENESLKRQLIASNTTNVYEFTERGLYKTVEKAGLVEHRLQNSI